MKNNVTLELWYSGTRVDGFGLSSEMTEKLIEFSQRIGMSVPEALRFILESAFDSGYVDMLCMINFVKAGK